MTHSSRVGKNVPVAGPDELNELQHKLRESATRGSSFCWELSGQNRQALTLVAVMKNMSKK